MSRRIALVVTAVALVALAVIGGLTGSDAAPPTVAAPTYAPVTTRTLVCPQLSGAGFDVSTNVVVADVAGALSPVPGGVGPVTTALLLRHVTDAAGQR